jgi:hypothetical protein
MADPSVTFRILRKDMAEGVGGSAGAVSESQGGGSVLSKRGMAAAVTLPITDVLEGILKGIGFLADASPTLGAEMIRFRKAMELSLMPVGDVLANHLRPFAMKWLDVAIDFYEDYRTGGFWTAMGEAFKNIGLALITDEEGNISFTGTLDNLDDLTTITAGVIIASAAVKAGGASLMGMVAGGLGGASAGVAAGTVAGGPGLLLSAALAFVGGKILADILGIEGTAAGVVAAMATALSLGTVLVSGVGMAVAIPMALSVVGVTGVLSQLSGDFSDMSPEFTDVNKGQGTVGKRWDNEKMAMVDFYQTADEMGKGFEERFLTDDEFMPGVKDSMDLLTNTYLSGKKGSLSHAAEQAIFGGDGVINGFVALGSEIDVEREKVSGLTEDLNNLPNIERTIKYKIVYEKEGRSGPFRGEA